MHRFPRLFAAAFLLVSSAAAERVSVTLLATTDLHGNIYPIDYFTGKPADRGLAKIATLIRAARRENPNTLLIDCGDTIQGSPLESVWQSYVSTGALPLGLRFAGPPLGADPMMLAMNELGYAAMVLGNHEFNFSLKNLERAHAEARFPWLSANTVAQPGSRVKPFERYIVKTVGGVKIAVIGITTTAIPNWDPPENYAGYRFVNEKEALESALGDLRRDQKPDLIIVAVHSSEQTVRDLAAAPGIDAIVYGHTHQQEPGRQIGEVLVVQPKNWGISMARLDFDLERGASGQWRITGKRSRLLPVTADTPADPEVLAAARPYHELTERYLNTPVADSPVEMDGRLARIEDSPLVDAIHEVQMHYAHADVSFTSLFNPRVRVPKGPVTVRELAALYIYDNELYAIEGDGRMIKAALENAARYFRSCPDSACSHGPLVNPSVVGFNYDMAQGVEYEIDLTRPEGDRVVNLRRHGKPLPPDEKVRIAVNNYRAGGSGGYKMFRGARILWQSSQDVRALMIEYYTQRKKMPAGADRNWRIVPPQARELLVRESLEEAARPGTR